MSKKFKTLTLTTWIDTYITSTIIGLQLNGCHRKNSTKKKKKIHYSTRKKEREKVSKKVKSNNQSKITSSQAIIVTVMVITATDRHLLDSYPT